MLELARARLAVDVGGTFTDVALEIGTDRTTSKVLTTPKAPEEGVLAGVELALEKAGIGFEAITVLIHGTTLATNALIERKGAKTALLTTEGLRDSVEMAQENRFEQYDINIDRPEPLVPRYLRWPVRERLNLHGDVLIPLDEHSVRALVPAIETHGIEAIAVGLIHSYANGTHERRVAEILSEACPGLAITLSSEVCPEIREYERQSTACANAYVQPTMAGYLTRLDAALKARGMTCPFLLMTSGGGLTTLETAVKFPIRLVESGPAGGAILATEIARECALDDVVSFDMGGTTAKICLIDGLEPQMTRTFEVGRVYRNLKGSGLPVRIPAIEMVEIGAGGGSIAHVDGMGRLQVGPESAGSEPGPASYGRGGAAPTVTDADILLGKIDPDKFAGGRVKLDLPAAEKAMVSGIAKALDLNSDLAAFAVNEIVDENMANAARVHAIEWGKDISARSMVAFGGAAPLHACRLAEKLDIGTVVVPSGAGVGSAIGFLRAPIAYEVVRSRYMSLAAFDAEAANALIEEMSAEARGIVEGGSGSTALSESRQAFMRYVGQGHEIVVDLPNRPLTEADSATLKQAFERVYEKLYGRVIPGQEPEILSWTLTARAPTEAGGDLAVSEIEGAVSVSPVGHRSVWDVTSEGFAESAVYERDQLPPGAWVEGPCLIVEDQTTTLVTANFGAEIDGRGYIVLRRLGADKGEA